MRLIYVEAIDYVSHHRSECVDGNVFGVLNQLDVRRRCRRVVQIVIEERWRQISSLYHSCLHLSLFRSLLDKINFGSSDLHIVVETASDCCRYVGVVDTVAQMLTFHIVECSCQIEREECCSVNRCSTFDAGRNVGGDRRQCSACRVFRPNAMLSRVEMDVYQYFWQQEFFQR